MINPIKLRAIVESDCLDLRSLASIAGGSPASFYRGANFDNADLRGQDLRGFNLEASTFKGARMDRTTRVDKRFLDLVGLSRIETQIPVSEVAVLLALSNCRIKIEKNLSSQLGDIIGEATYLPFDAIIAQLMNDKNGFVGRTELRLANFEHMIQQSAVIGDAHLWTSRLEMIDDAFSTNLFPGIPNRLKAKTIKNAVKRHSSKLTIAKITKTTFERLEAILNDKRLERDWIKRSTPLICFELFRLYLITAETSRWFSKPTA